jgi:hypothetical protein
VQMRMDDGTTRTERSFTFNDLGRPDKILGDLGGPLLSTAIGSMGLPLHSTNQLSAARLDLKWDAREDKLKVGGTYMRVYRLQTRLLDSVPVIIYVSRVGEILRIELPDEVVLANDVLLNL